MPAFKPVHCLVPAGVALLLALAPAHAAGPAERLRTEASAFLRANAGSLVEWMPWGEAAFERAKREQKPVYLAVGAFTSELSQAMARQSFAHTDTAAFLNANFVCVLVDREEQPAVAALGLAYVRTVKQLDGWPLNLWLTPELMPFEGATYLPPSEEWGKASFLKIARQVRESWTTDPAGCRTRAGEAVTALAAATPVLPAAASAGANLAGRLRDAGAAWRATVDATHGGFGDAPKNPEPELLRFLLRQTPADRDAALATLRAIAASALRDPLDGGFFRYATDTAWRVPYLQKTLADQARLALAFLDAAQAAGDPLFKSAAAGALDFALIRLARPDGLFAAAEDATADEFAGYYAWAESEINATLGADAAAFNAAHGVVAAGNVTADDDPLGRYRSKNLLHPAAPDAASFAAGASRLRALRDRRPAPPRDERATAAAQGLLLAALARAGRELNEPRFLQAAARLHGAVEKDILLPTGGDLRHLAGSAVPAAPADYAAVALGCREFARAAQKPAAEALATRLLARAAELFLDPARGRYFATATSLPAGIPVRPPASDDAPRAESLALLAGVSPQQAAALSAGLLALLEESPAAASGDVLLALGR